MDEDKRALFDELRKESERESLIVAVHAKKVHYVPDEHQLVAQNKRLWVEDWQDVVEKILSLSIVTRYEEASVQPVDPLPEPKVGAVIECNVTVEVSYDGQIEYVDVPFHITVRRSIEEERKNSGYFAGKVQLRGSHLETSEDTAVALTKQLGAHITKRVEERGGVDLYIDDIKAIRQVALGLQQQLGGEVDLSPTLFSRDNQTQKDIFRLTALYRAYPFLKGDVILYAGEVWQLQKVGKFIEMASLVERKTQRVQNSDGIELVSFSPALIITKEPLLVSDATSFEQFEDVILVGELKDLPIEYALGPDKRCYVRNVIKK